jgi:hypothetical protein
MIVTTISKVNYTYLKKNNTTKPIISQLKNETPTGSQISFNGLFYEAKVSTPKEIIQKLIQKRHGTSIKIKNVFKFITLDEYQKMPKENISELIMKKQKMNTNDIRDVQGFSPSNVNNFLEEKFKTLTNVKMVVGNGFQELILPADFALRKKALKIFTTHKATEEEIDYLNYVSQNGIADYEFNIASNMVRDANIEGLFLEKFLV